VKDQEEKSRSFSEKFLELLSVTVVALILIVLMAKIVFF